MFFRSHEKQKGTQPGASPFPPLSAERIAAARQRHGDAIDPYLAHLHLGDPIADDLILHFEKLPQDHGFRMLSHALKNGIASIDNPPKPLVVLFEQLDSVPAWVDWDLMRVASKKIIRSGLLTALSFAAYALPHTYLATANKPLAFTRTLLNKTAHRYAQTLRLITESFLPGGLQRQADGFELVVFVRVLHARIRRQILQSNKWDKSTPELPLNQAHMAMDVIFFSRYVIQGMKRLGMRLTRREAEGVLMTWRYIGYLFAIDPEMVCASKEQARRMIEIAFSLEFDPDETSKQLCQALIHAGPALMKIENERQARFFVSMANPISRHLLGDKLADQLGYPKQKRRLLCYGFIALVWLSERVPWLVPRAIKEYKGVVFWLEKGDYETSIFD